MGDMEQEINTLSNQGWHIVYIGETLIQLRRPKQVSRLGLAVAGPILLVALFLPALMSFALLALFIVGADYWVRRDELMILFVDDVPD